MCLFTKQYWQEYFRSGFLVDVRSALIGIAVGGIVGAITVAFAAPDPIEYLVSLGNAGAAQPLRALAYNLTLDKKPPKVVFDPADLQQAWVCEGAYISGASHKEILLKYIDRYSGCFDLDQVDKESYIVHANNVSGLLKKDKRGEWACKCPSN